MYKFPYFKDKDHDSVLKFMNDHPFAFISGCDKMGRPVSTQVPILMNDVEGEIYLIGHLMKKTDHYQAFEQNKEVLVVFTGPSAYVSATWYDNPFQGSTWNYMSVHVTGKIEFLDEAGLKLILQKTSLHFEKGKETSSTVFNNLPEEYIERLIKAIAGFRIKIETIDHTFKLSQNRTPNEYIHIIDELRKGNNEAIFIADEMEKIQFKLFGQKE